MNLATLVFRLQHSPLTAARSRWRHLRCVFTPASPPRSYFSNVSTVSSSLSYGFLDHVALSRAPPLAHQRFSDSFVSLCACVRVRCPALPVGKQQGEKERKRYVDRNLLILCFEGDCAALVSVLASVRTVTSR